MVIKDLKENIDIVVGNFHKGEKEDYLCYFTKNDNCITPTIRFSDNHYHIGMVGYPRFTPIRLATYEEANWLKACEKAGKYVEKPENVIQTIQIW